MAGTGAIGQGPHEGITDGIPEARNEQERSDGGRRDFTNLGIVVENPSVDSEEEDVRSGVSEAIAHLFPEGETG